MAEDNQTYDTIVVGSGPAGLTAAIYNVRAALKTIVISGDQPGGQLTVTTTIDNWPGFPNGGGGVKLMMGMQQQVKNLGVEIKYDSVNKIEKNDFGFEVKIGENEVLKCKAVILATGAGAKWLGIPKEKELLGRGISGCATCDGMFYRDKEVAIVGGGNSAVEEAEFLSKICTKVYIIHRRDQFRATAAEVEKIMRNEKVEKIWNSEVSEIIGEEKLTGIKIKNNKTGEERELSISGLFVAIGRKPATDFVKDLIELNESGYVITGKKLEYPSMTSTEGIFAAGDCMDEVYRQAIVAAGAGAKAAIDAERWLEIKK